MSMTTFNLDSEQILFSGYLDIGALICFILVNITYFTITTWEEYMRQKRLNYIKNKKKIARDKFKSTREVSQEKLEKDKAKIRDRVENAKVKYSNGRPNLDLKYDKPTALDVINEQDEINLSLNESDMEIEIKSQNKFILLNKHDDLIHKID